MPEYALGDVSVAGEARRVSPEWARAQDRLTAAAAQFLRDRLPAAVSVAEDRERSGTLWSVDLGSRPANLVAGAAFRRKFGDLATYEVRGRLEEYRLKLANPREAWRASRGRAFRSLYLFAILAIFGAVLMFRPSVVLDAMPRRA